MGRFRQLTILFCLLLWGMSSCEKKSNAPILRLSCSPEEPAIEAAIASHLSGEWNWKASGNCGGLEEDYSDTAEKGVSIRFKEGATFEEVKDGQIVTAGNYQIEKQGENIYYIRAEPSHRLLHGQILYCDQELMFYDSFRDGCDQLFVRSRGNED